MSIKKMVLAALFLALALYLPFLTGQIPQIGSMISPMHFPVLLAGFVCGPGYGLAVGFIAPLMRSFLFGMPPFPVVALPMAFELAAYGLLTGLFYKILPKRPGSIYGALLAAMVGGRIVWGLVRYAMLFTGTPFTWEIYISSVIMGSLPGIILQIVLIPLLVMALQRAGVMENV
ncbi:MAG TPA: ECF transporter S component [Firmicutes bacterium]|nr:ECF transporter S component [Bacillota bacterium]